MYFSCVLCCLTASDHKPYPRFGNDTGLGIDWYLKSDGSGSNPLLPAWIRILHCDHPWLTYL